MIRITIESDYFKIEESVKKFKEIENTPDAYVVIKMELGNCTDDMTSIYKLMKYHGLNIVIKTITTKYGDIKFELEAFRGHKDSPPIVWRF